MKFKQIFEENYVVRDFEYYINNGNIILKGISYNQFIKNPKVQWFINGLDGKIYNGYFENENFIRGKFFGSDDGISLSRKTVIGLDQNGLVFYSGYFMGGVWENGTMDGGHFGGSRSSVLRIGEPIFKNPIWKNGIWKSGFWDDNNNPKPIWIKGYVDGKFTKNPPLETRFKKMVENKKIILDGIRYGEFIKNPKVQWFIDGLNEGKIKFNEAQIGVDENGLIVYFCFPWWEGIFENGTWKDDSKFNGIWKNGIWDSNDGYGWLDGAKWIKGKINGEKSLVNPVEYFKNLEKFDNTKEYFDNIQKNSNKKTFKKYAFLREIDDETLYFVAHYLSQLFNVKEKISLKEIKKLSIKDINFGSKFSKTVMKSFIQKFSNSFSVIDIYEYAKNLKTSNSIDEKSVKSIANQLKIDFSVWDEGIQSIFDNRLNYVIQFNWDEYGKDLLSREKEILANHSGDPQDYANNEMNLLAYIKNSNHPTSRKSLTLAWCRYTIFNELNAVVLDEIQTDLDNEKFLGRSFMKGWEVIIMRKFIDFVRHKLHYQKILMPTYDTKIDKYDANPPMYLYKELPNKFGFKKMKEPITLDNGQYDMLILEKYLKFKDIIGDI